MDCPHCGRDLPEGNLARGRCPHCHQRVPTPPVAVVRTAAVRVAEAEGEQVYRSIAEVPPEVRQKIQKALQGPDSETIIIANQEGRERIVQALHGLPPQTRKKVMAALGLSEPEAPRLSRRGKVLLLAALLLGLILSLWWIWLR